MNIKPKKLSQVGEWNKGWLGPASLKSSRVRNLVETINTDRDPLKKLSWSWPRVTKSWPMLPKTTPSP